MDIGSLIPGVPAGVTYAIIGIAVLILLFHGVTMVKGLARMVSNIGKPKPKPVNVGTILK
tara:strand:- start:507 stop:686 length:180 start_codon:yes stop_codon:yes gene_type:complete